MRASGAVVAARWILLALAAWAGLGTAPARAGDDAPQVDASVSARVAHLGRARVLVELRLASGPIVAEGRLATWAAVLGQRGEIAAAQQQVLARLGGRAHTVLHRYGTVPYLALEVESTALAALGSARDVRRVMADTPKAPALAQSVPLIQGNLAWAAGFDGTGTAVAILDTGVDGAHPFLAGKLAAEACFSSTVAGQSTSLCPNGQPVDVGPGAAVPCTVSSCWHGTHVAGIAAGNGAGAGVAFSGVARGAAIVAVQVFSRFEGIASCGTPSPCVLAWTSDIIAGLEHVYSLRHTQPIAAVNLSLGAGLFSAPCDGEAERPIIANLRAAGIVTVIAAGNGASRTALSSPACISSAVSAGATDKGNGISAFTNVAPFLSLMAPGQSIVSSIPGGIFASASGTSMAAPHVTGAFAVLRQAAPLTSAGDLLAALQETGLPIPDTRSSGTVTTPRVSIYDALVALDTGVHPAPSLSALEPDTAPAGSPALTLTVSGTDFTASSVIRWNGLPRNTTFVDSGELAAEISASDLAAAGTAQVTVFTPPPGGGASNPLQFSISHGAFVCPDSVIVDNLAPGQSSSQVSFTGAWGLAWRPQSFGANTALVSFGFQPASYTWRTPVFSADRSCTYEVSAWWTSGPWRSSRVPYTVSGQTGAAVTRTFDQRSGAGQWNLHGTYTFPAGGSGTVTMTSQNGPASADAVRFLLVP